MSYLRRNFEDIKYEFYDTRSSVNASKFLKTKEIADLSDLLRHHSSRRITLDETWDRDAFDFLLSYYSMLEIAMIVGFVDAIPPFDARRAIEELSHPALKRYYRTHYRLSLPHKFLRRLEAGEGRQVEANTFHLGIFMEFMTLTEFFETDEDLEAFLWFLDDGTRERYSFSDTLRVLGSTEELLHSLTKKPSQKTALDHSVEGFGKFLNFCTRLDAILRSCRRSRRLRRALFTYHAYWFTRLRQKLKSRMDDALTSYVEVRHSRLDENTGIRQVQDALHRLLSTKYLK